MALFFFLLGQNPILVILFSASMFVLAVSTVVVVLTWRLAWILWYHNTARNGVASSAVGYRSSLRPDRGLDWRALQSLPRAEYDSRVDSKLTECPICLTEFIDRDVVRVLPHCGHGFHVDCIDRWLGCHSSCPSCRGVLGSGMYPNPRGL